MQLIESNRLDPADHLALDEAALLMAEENLMPESLRIWQFDQPVLVLGRSSKVDFEVNRPFCESAGISILRRCSGGASIIGGPGCLMYSVVVSLEEHPELRKIDAAHRYVIGRVLSSVKQSVPDAKLQGICDLTLDGRKFSGNSLRVSRGHLLYHGTVLHDADLSLLANGLRGAPRQPEYRDGRDHIDFVANVPLDVAGFTQAMIDVFDVQMPAMTELPRRRMQELRKERYDSASWHFRH